MGWRGQQNADGPGDDEKNSTVAPLDAADIEFFAEEDARCEDDEQDEGQEKNLRLQAERHPTVADERKDGQGDGDQLVEEKNQPERSRPSDEEAPERFRSAVLPPRKVVGDQAEADQPEAVRDGEAEQPRETELRGELHREKQPEAPHPREGNGVAPEQGVEPAVRFEFVGGGHQVQKFVLRKPYHTARASPTHCWRPLSERLS